MNSSNAIEAPGAPLSPVQFLIALWGVLGVLALLTQALVRLAPMALEPIVKGQYGPGHWALCIAWMLFMAHSEGYKGFQKRFSPRVVARAVHLSRHPRVVHVLFAPLFCMAFFHATKRGLAIAWGVTSMVIVLVIVVRMLPQPWRGIIDAGVVVGLLWGAIAIVAFFVKGVRGHELPVNPELPDAEGRS